MKTRFQMPGLAALLLGGACSAGAQGMLTFANRVTGAGIDAPVTYLGSPRIGLPNPGGRAAGSDFLAQLVIHNPATGEFYYSPPKPFRTGVAAGYVSVTAVAVPGIPGGTTVTVTMLAWFSELGTSYTEVASRIGTGVGSSAPIQITLTEPPAQPAALVGLQGFSVI
jgi:hypothetical protein